MDGDLATELRLSICQYLSGEKATLQNLSLVSRNWLAPAQACMFEKIGACVLFPSKDDNTHSPAGLSRFFRSSPHLATYVREVQIVGAYSLITCGFGALYPLLNVEDIFEVVSVIPNLHILTIRTCEVNAGPSKGLIDPTKRCLSVRDLSLLRIGVNDFSLWLLLDRFNVVNLYVDGTTIYGSKDTIKLSPSYSVATRTLDLSAVEYYQSHPTPLSADVILSVPDSLKNFGISCNLKEAKEVETICVFLETSVPNLEHLCLDYTGIATEKIARRWRKSVKIPKEGTSFYVLVVYSMLTI
ncbi:hypothetical protein EUX98_g2728 [Antrodiella citrinella]|uniref:F-box domain-containing protein n=1 Tax=Antrodiella citrinella TaxID=2447956 RepID=A0A4S4MYA6_9APHY|nr:hypothetical protein EUX98_g2728 [Antrodiella citrinella]